MAEYKFACSECGRTFVIEHEMNEEHPAQIFCPHCFSMEVIRVWTPIPIHFKGSGFYTTDEGWKKEYE